MRLRAFVIALALLGVWAAAAQPSGAGGGVVAGQEAAVWYYAIRDKTMGPHTLGEMQAFCTDGTIRRESQVYHPDFNWRFARDVPELQAAFAAAPPPPPPPPTPPPPPPSIASQYNEAAAALLEGNWRYPTVMAMNGMQVQVVYDFSFRRSGGAAGSFSGSQTVTMPPMGGLPNPVVATAPIGGTWTLVALDETNFTLTVQYMPQSATAPPTSLYPISDSFTVVDNNTLRSSEGNTMSRLP